MRTCLPSQLYYSYNKTFVQRCKAPHVVEGRPHRSHTKAETHQEREQISPSNITDDFSIQDRRGPGVLAETCTTNNISIYKL